MNQIEFKNRQIGEIVADDFRTSRVFTEVGIDFCCGGKQTVGQACDELGIDVSTLEIKVGEIKQKEINANLNFKDWSLNFLIDYIQNVHHTYVKNTLPELLFYTGKIASVHGERHPELIQIANDVKNVSEELTLHLEMEENVLFPAILSFLANPGNDTKSTIVSEITRMLGEHDFAGGVFDKINKTTEGYKTPEDACNTYEVAFKTMKQFEDDLHVHVHLENNILFPKALKL
ncbi:iron-sulfur cluster repair di-iron protein [Maribellus sediminis]|uniref:iron-sulfur cluster repair di-iron protein n=1 Tax=Maribellus sediminis TaxID=2696285 RepID=UPI001432284A|nr:iron-sulfur cluster repair di-iron protein [Maribellus sediminis]